MKKNKKRRVDFDSPFFEKYRLWKLLIFIC